MARRLGYSPVVLDEATTPTVDGSVFEGVRLAIVSPGLALTHRWLQQCRTMGVALVSELQFGVEELRRQRVRLLAVTGSKGKSSVVKVVADGLNRAGVVRAVPCGNYGKPVCEVALEGGVEWSVVEVSSFQMETTNLAPDTFEAAAILNLQEDHLDRHGSVAVYHGLKRRLLGMARVRLEGPEGLDELRELLKDSYFDNEILAGNGCLAARLMQVAGLDSDAIRAAFRTFEPLPHRMNEVGTFGGVRCIDDSKATSLAALAAGVVMAGADVRLIAGGLPKGDDPKSVLGVLTKRVKKVYLIGRCAEVFSAAWSGAVDCEICGTMERAVGTALHEAARGETLLLSPGTASFDQFKSFGQRGDVFAALVKKEGQGKS